MDLTYFWSKSKSVDKLTGEPTLETTHNSVNQVVYDQIDEFQKMSLSEYGRAIRLELEVFAEKETVKLLMQSPDFIFMNDLPKTGTYSEPLGKIKDVIVYLHKALVEGTIRTVATFEDKVGRPKTFYGNVKVLP